MREEGWACLRVGQHGTPATPHKQRTALIMAGNTVWSLHSSAVQMPGQAGSCGVNQRKAELARGFLLVCGSIPRQVMDLIICLGVNGSLTVPASTVNRMLFSTCCMHATFTARYCCLHATECIAIVHVMRPLTQALCTMHVLSLPYKSDRHP